MSNQQIKRKQPQEVERVTKRHYSLVTLVLIICIIELTISCITNIKKDLHFSSKIKGLEDKRNQELAKNEQLKSQVKNFNSEVILESITRNNLKMAGENEILVIIHKPNEKEEQKEHREEPLFNKEKTVN